MYFEKGAETLIPEENKFLVDNNNQSDDPVDNIVKKFEFHPSILLIKENISHFSQNKFSFIETSFSVVEKEIKELNPKKGNGCHGIPTKLFKKCSSDTVFIVHNIFNKSLLSGNFPNELKLACISPIFKKDDHLDKKKL